MTFYWKEIRGKKAVAKLNTILRQGLQYSALREIDGSLMLMLRSHQKAKLEPRRPVP
jgi:hypothetical protein